MTEPPSPNHSTDGLDLERLKAEIRTAAARRTCAVEADGADWAAVSASLKQVERLADVGAGVPELPRLRGIWRFAGRFAARLVLLATRFLTNRQRECNHAVLVALTNVQDALRRMQQDHAAEIRALREELAYARGQHHAGAARSKAA